MVKALRKIINKILPEVRGNYHLPKDGRVVSISDPPQDESTATDSFRPYYAVDVQLLKADGSDDTDQPIIEALPLSVAMAGDDSGQFGFPKVGTWVVIGFRYGSPGHPFILSILTHNLTVPPIEDGEQLWQHSPGSYQKVDKEGNWERKSNGKITDDSQDREIYADSNIEEFGESNKIVNGDDIEEIGGSKELEALGALLLKSGGNLQLHSIMQSFFTFLSNHTELIGKDRQIIIGGKEDKTILTGPYTFKVGAYIFSFDAATGLTITVGTTILKVDATGIYVT